MQKVMIAGIGGASLGTELLKALMLSGKYEVYGCDISRTAYGLYDAGFTQTFCVDRDNYVRSVISACRAVGAQWLIPGGEQPMVLLGKSIEQVRIAGLQLVSNSASVIETFSDKSETFKLLRQAGIPVPRTKAIDGPADVRYVGLPCIIKPATGSGGSASVFFAVTVDEAMIYADFIRRNGSVALAQEYIGEEEGEFTVGVLSLPDGAIVGSVALRRTLEAKLSVSYRGRGGLISSGYSQGYIGPFLEICEQAQIIAKAVGSKGPINIQGRVKSGIFLPFEINPRFSASTYLRAMAGFNEVDILIDYLAFGTLAKRPAISPGWYLRSLTESFTPDEKLK
ncbi:ATP-grasp domain-containing protein [Alcaligenaceae bacterium]|nr:ATP-grasp domain-containing protein [Alcaligenaceae bacterium]